MQLAATKTSSEPRTVAFTIIAAAIGFGIAAASFWAAGDTLGFWIGVFFGVTLALPALSAAHDTVGAAAIVAASLSVAAMLPLLILPDHRLYPIADRIWLCAVLAAWCLTLFGLVRWLSAIRLGVSASVAVVTFAAIAWLLMPLWIPSSSSALVSPLAEFHPPLIANGMLQSTPPWTEMPIAYAQLTELNQDVPLTLPRSAAPCIAAYSIVGVLFFTFSRIRLCRRTPI